jgi:hypothetical protein
MNVKPKIALITTIVAALAIVGALAGYAALSASASTGLLAATSSTASTNSATSNLITSPTPMQQGGHGGPGGPGGFGGPGMGIQGNHQSQVNLTVGQTVTITSTSGQYYQVGKTTANGTASGTFTFTVTGKLSTGYILSISSGSVTVNAVKYTVFSGSAQMALSADSISGQGTTTSSGVFAIQAQAHGSFVGSSASVTLDFSNGTTEYAVFLSGTA